MALIKSCQILVKDYESAQKSQNLLKLLEGGNEKISPVQFELYSAAKQTLAITEICKKMENLPEYDKLRLVSMEILNETSRPLNIDAKVLDAWMKKLDQVNSENLHSNAQKSLNSLTSIVVRYSKFVPKDSEIKDGLNEKFESAVMSETKSRFLALQTVQKKIAEFQIENKGKPFFAMLI